MIEREITQRLKSLHRQYPVVTLTGPRQAGKTTLCREAFAELRYFNLEAPDQREFAESDPRGFLAQASSGAVIDEIQHVPELLSYIQVDVDERGRNGLYILTGSEQFRLSQAISQSLAGRTALLRLLPFSMAERSHTGASMAIDDVISSGFYPRILDHGLDPQQALGDYFETYVERDVRRSNEIRNIASFRRFVRLCAGRVGQLVNLSSLGADVGVSHTTAREWLTILEASYVVFLLQPYHANVGKRLIKSPKLYFYDVGLASFLIGIENARQVATHPLRGPLFENAVVTEALKHRLNRGRQPHLWFFRDSNGLECDLLCESGNGMAAIEIKSGLTLSSDHFSALHKLAEILPGISSRTVVYGGTERVLRSHAEAVPLAGLSGVLDRLDVDEYVTEFIRERRGPNPSQMDIESLDAVYMDHARPIAEGLEHHCSRVGEQLFSSHHQFVELQHGKIWMRAHSFADGTWERFRSECTSTAGFAISDDKPIVMTYSCSFRGYTGRGGGDFDIELSVEWSLRSRGLDLVVMLDAVAMPGLGLRTPSADLSRTPFCTDQSVAATVEALLDRIEELAQEPSE